MAGRRTGRAPQPRSPRSRDRPSDVRRRSAGPRHPPGPRSRPSCSPRPSPRRVAGQASRHGPASRSMSSRHSVAGAARTTMSAPAKRRLRRRRGEVDDAVRPSLGRPITRRRPGRHRPVAGRRVGPDRACDRTADQAESEEGELHSGEYRSRRIGRFEGPAQSPQCRPRAAARPSAPTPRRPAIGVTSLAGAGVRRRRPPCACHGPSVPAAAQAGQDRPAGSCAGSPSVAHRLVVRRTGARRSADSAAPPRTARRAARPCRSVGRRPGTTGWAWRRCPLRPSADSPARPRPSRAGTRNPRGCHRGSARRPRGRSARGRTG